MSFTFETASISLCVGAILSVLLQGKVLDEARHVPPGVARTIRLVDMWLATVFIILVGLAIAVSYIGIARGRPLGKTDRDAVEHLLMLAALYPVAMALTRRALPILFDEPEAPYMRSRAETTIFLLVLVGPVVAIAMPSQLVDPAASLKHAWLSIALAGAAIVTPAAAAPSVAGWWARRSTRRARGEAARLRLLEQRVTGTLPEIGAQIVVRTFVGVHGRWIDRREAERVLRHLREATHVRRRRGEDRPAGTGWFVLSPWPLRRLTRMGVEGDPSATRSWPRLGKSFVAAEELLRALGVPQAAAQRPLSAARSAAKPG